MLLVLNGLLTFGRFLLCTQYRTQMLLSRSEPISLLVRSNGWTVFLHRCRTSFKRRFSRLFVWSDFTSTIDVRLMTAFVWVATGVNKPLEANDSNPWEPPI
ncbi:uncharacterized protein LAESUDRAFT_493140 [Laetiporus sulphureus 93-53]|uniref:Secreted protein n=1 Tax=Laetiporus sulphureus 93-53 TaxID=1314785 RepID=A0A165BJ54_9APHY|nr:uncharacterized protein LAESUDRAFT_493140 [Laetiporus sulphureus 93-53]KZT01156.1 hypothetical protein LAESUDRAFT_493140 [Laetiporus sulphureus 93-53]